MFFIRVLLFVLCFCLSVIANDRIYLNSSQQKWIQNHSNSLVIGVCQIPNQVLKEKNGKLKGFSIDLFNLIEKKLGIKFKYRYYKSWSLLMDTAKQKNIDIVFLAQKNAKRLEYLNFTDPVLSQQNKIIINISKNNIKKDTDLIGKTVVIVKGSAIEQYIQTNYPTIKIVRVSNEIEALKYVSNFKADATIMEPVRASYYIEKNGIDNITIAGNFGLKYHLRIASSINYPELNIILNRALDTITEAKKKELLLKWGYIKDHGYIDNETLFYIVIAFLILIPFLIYISIINKKLKREIKNKQKAEDELKKLNKTLQKRVEEETEKNRQHQLLIARQNRLTQLAEMVSMIAHQWRQPLNSLSIVIQTIQLKYALNKLNDNNMKKFIKTSKQLIDKMSKTIDDFQRFYSPNDKKIDFKLDDVIQDAIKIIKPTLDDKNISLIYNIYDKNIKIHGYPSELGLVLINIITNAKEAFNHIDKKDKKIIIDPFKNSDIWLCIKDNAGGIDKEIADKIFDPYFTTKSDKNGAGLGLYMSKMILQEHFKGDLLFENIKDGAKFCIVLRQL